jgi:hypothetical protein
MTTVAVDGVELGVESYGAEGAPLVFPVGNGEALAREIPGARLLVLEDAATALPDSATPEVATAMLALR